MTTALATLTAQETAQAQTYARAATAPATARAYRADWADWTAWAEAHGTPAMPADGEMLAVYLSGQAETHKPASIARRLAAIAAAHRGVSQPRTHPAVKAVLQGIRRLHGVKQAQARPILPEELRAAVADASLRDRALLLIGFSGGFRRSELVALDIEDLAFAAAGLTITVVRSKTDQIGQGRQLGIPAGAATEALTAYLADRASGPVFLNDAGSRLSGAAVGVIVKARLGAAYSAHGLRRGFVTAAVKAGKSVLAVQRTTGHRSLGMLSRYYEADVLGDDNAARGIV